MQEFRAAGMPPGRVLTRAEALDPRKGGDVFMVWRWDQENAETMRQRMLALLYRS